MSAFSNLVLSLCLLSTYQCEHYSFSWILLMHYHYKLLLLTPCINGYAKYGEVLTKVHRSLRMLIPTVSVDTVAILVHAVGVAVDSRPTRVSERFFIATVNCWDVTRLMIGDIFWNRRTAILVCLRNLPIISWCWQTSKSNHTTEQMNTHPPPPPQKKKKRNKELFFFLIKKTEK